VLPALEELQSAWEKKRDSPRYTLYKGALTNGLEKLGKYYSRLDEKPSFVLALGKNFGSMFWFVLTNTFTVLHPYYKLAYTKISWGGKEEQAAEIKAGNPEAKNWHDEARQLVERTVRRVVIVTRTILITYKTDGRVLSQSPLDGSRHPCWECVLCHIYVAGSSCHVRIRQAS